MSPKDQAASFLKWVRSISSSLIADFPESAMTRQSCPTDNHAAWVLGHVAATDAWIAGLIGIPGVNLPENYEKLYGQGSKPIADPKAYPSSAELRKLFDANRAALLKWLESASESALSVSLKEKSGGFCTDPIDAMHKLCWHEGWHFGQVASARKAMGMKPVMG